MKRGLLTGLLLALGVVSVQAQTLYDDFETTPGATRLVTYRPTTGGALIQNQLNPGANAVNMSSTVARYTRSADQYDNFDIETPRAMADVTPYINNTKRITMKFYSALPGTQVMLVLQNKTKNRSGGYPAGKYLGEFTATTTLNNAWETLTFTFNAVGAGNFDPTVTATTIDEITVLIAPNSNGRGVYHFDDIVGPELSSGTGGTGTAAPAVTQLFDDFDATRKLSYPNAGAVLTPGLTAPAGNNTVVARYIRGADAYDQLQMAPANATFFDDVSGFASTTATVKPSLKFYNPTADAIPVRLIFANNALRGNNTYSTGTTGIAGTHSVYTATTSAAAGWQTLTFTYQAGPNAGAYDASVKSTAIDRVLLQINPGAGVGQQYHLDDITLPAATIPVARLYENFNNVRSLTYVSQDGVLTQSAANPSTTGSNPNPLVGKYDRSANMYDAFYVKLPAGAVADDVTDFFNGTRKMTMKVYSPRPAGAIVTIYMLDNSATGSNYPNGRDAYYQATTTKQNDWETLTFTLTTRLGAGVAQQRNINGFGIQLGDNSTATGTWYFDQFYGPNYTVAPGTLYDNFENTRQLTYTAATGGTLNASYANPAVFDENYTATVGHYSRSANATDVLLARATGKQLDDVSSYVSGTNSFYLKVFSKTIGTPIRLLLQNAAKAGSTGTATGTHSVFQATTTKSNQWETLRFTYQTGGNDATVTATQVDQLALLFNPGSTLGGQTFDFDFFVGQSLVTATAPPAGTAVTQLYDDFENTRQLTLKQVDGTFTPGQTAPAGNSTVVARYVRSANAYDTFEMAPANATFFNDVTGFASPTATVKATMKIYSTVAGTAQLVFANAATTTASNYPTGRHSIYTAPMTAAGWQTLTFTYQMTPDASVKGTAVDRVQLQLTPGVGATGTYYFDDITLPATTMPVARLYENFNDVRELTYGAGDGVLTQRFANPSTTGANANPLVGKYVRSAVAYDTFYANYPAGATADDISDFVNGNRKMTMKVYAPAAGRPVTITLLDPTATPGNYPTGRNSFYTATTTVANAWETLTFNYAGTPTGGVNPVHNISGINIQFDGGNGAASTWYFDQLYGPNFTVAPGALYDNFESVRDLSYNAAGTLTQNFANPSVFEANYSPTVARYQRAATAYATITITPNGGKRLTNVSAYASTTATKFFYLKVFSQHIGTPVQLVLQNAAKANTGYPNGNQSIYNATTTKSNQWETLRFTYQAADPGVSTDASVSVNQVNQMALLFNPGDATAGQTYYFDFFVGQDLLLATGLTWNGSVSTDWNDGDNWSGGVAPVAVSGAPAIIPGGLGRYPILTAGNTYGSPDIIINAGGSLTQTGGTFNLANGVTNNGTYSQTGGVTNLAGTSSHIFGNGNPMLFYDLNVGVGGMGLLGGPNGTVSVKHRLVVAGPVTMNANGKLILLSDASGTAMVVHRGAGSVTGNVVVQRYIDGSLNATEGYRHLSAPVNGATVANLKTATGPVPVVNAAYNTAPDPGLVTPFPTVFTYDESRLTSANAITSGFFYGWKSPSATTEALTNGLGYTVNMAPGTVTFTGALHNGNYTVNLSRGATANSGWAFLGNPYPAPITWDSLARPTGVDNALYTFRSNGQYGGAYQSYVNGVGPAGANMVAMGQGFFTRVNSGTPTFTFTNAARKVSYASPVQYRNTSTDLRPRLDLALTNASGDSDVLYVYQEAGATTAFDSQFDALKVTLNGGTQPTLYQQAGTESFSIQGLPAGTQPVALALGVNAAAAGSFTFAAEQLLNFPATASVQLEDRQTGTLHDLRSGAYSVSLPQGLHDSRFVLHLYAQRALATAGPRAATALLAYPNPATAGTVVRLTNTKASGEVLNLTGQVVGSFANGKVTTTGLAAGVYMLRNAATGERSKLVIQ